MLGKFSLCWTPPPPTPFSLSITHFKSLNDTPLIRLCNKKKIMHSIFKMTNKTILLPKQLTKKFYTRILTRKLPMFKQIVLFNQKATTTKKPIK